MNVVDGSNESTRNDAAVDADASGARGQSSARTMKANACRRVSSSRGTSSSRSGAVTRRRGRARARARTNGDGDGVSERCAPSEAVVVGAGVIGMSVALALAEECGRFERVRVVAERFAEERGTTSSVAAAFWYPFLTRTDPPERADEWAVASFEWFRAMMREDEACGVEMRRCKEFLREPRRPAAWSSSVDYYAPLVAGEYDETRHCGGYAFDVPVIAMPKFLPWLKRRCETRGVSFERRRLTSVSELRGAELVVDCAGLGARELFGDEEIKPIRGQVVYLDQDCGEGLFDDDPEALAYLIPRRGEFGTVLGGTAQVNDFNLDPDPADERDIVAKCSKLWPQLDPSRIIGTNVGLRPSRSVVRCELDADASDAENFTLIHCVGHGGAGVTLCRGSALEVVDIVDALYE